jgi:hypothetical protein
MDAEHQLERRVPLATQTGEILVELGSEAAQRL